MKIELCASIAALCPVLAAVGSPTYTTINFPGATRTAAFGINDAGSIVGDSTDDKNLALITGWILSNGSFTELRFPGAAFTRPMAINGAGVIVGYFSDNKNSKNHGFILAAGSFTQLDVPDSDQTLAVGIDEDGTITGSFCDKGNSCYSPTDGGGSYLKGSTHGFVLTGGVFTVIDVPGALRTEVWKRNRSGKFLGRYYGPDGFFHVFVLGEGGFSSVDFPGAAETASGWYSWSGGFNDAGDIASIYCSFQPCDFFNFGFQSGKVHGFLATSDGFTSVDFPGADTTGVWGLNSRDEVVGVYLDAAGEHGFLRTP